MDSRGIIYKGQVYLAAEGDEEAPAEEEDAEERPDEAEMVQEIEDQPVADWREYLQPIIRAMRAQLGGVQISLLNPEVSNTYSSPQFGFDIVGFVEFPQGTPQALLEEFGDVPVKFQAYVSPDGKLIQPIEIFTDTISS